jgi:hypothetical protein
LSCKGIDSNAERDIIETLYDDIKNSYSIYLDSDFDLCRKPFSDPIPQQNESAPSVIIIVASNGGRLSSLLTMLGANSTHISMPSGKPSSASVKTAI